MWLEHVFLLLYLTGWEGTTHDARIFDYALTTSNMNFPHPPQDVDLGWQIIMNEVFNYYHSSLRCTMERTFGV
uniref:DDE Tnp4 domain-containing protein n=1 Tax=Glycine max TaxID=3847 RepID=A0A0R0L724_SOYBN